MRRVRGRGKHPSTDRKTRELLLLGLLSLPGLIALVLAIGWMGLGPSEEADLLAKPPVEEAEPVEIVTEPPPALEPFAIRDGSEPTIAHYRDADGVYHFVRQAPPAKAKVGAQAKQSDEAEPGIAY